MVPFQRIIPDYSVPPENINFDVSEYQMPTISAYRFPEDKRKIVALPDRRAYRSMSKSGALLSAACLSLSKQIGDTHFTDQNNRFSTGLYCAVDHGSDDFMALKKLMEVDSQSFPDSYRRLKDPKAYLRQLPNLSSAYVSIFLQIMGPTNTYTHSKYGCLHALNQTENDFKQGKIRSAIVATSFAMDDPILASRLHTKNSSTTLSEGAMAIFIETQEQISEMKSRLMNLSNSSYENKFFGISNPLMQITI